MRRVAFFIGLLPFVGGAAGVVDLQLKAAEVSNYERRTQIALGADAFTVSLSPTARANECTAWGVCTCRLPLRSGAMRWTLDFEIRAVREWYRVATSPHWQNAVKFYADDGQLLGSEALEIEFAPRGFIPFRFSGAIPARAATVTVQFGIDSNPPIRAGEPVEVRGLKLMTYAAGEAVPEPLAPDCQPPLVRSRLVSPVASGPVTVVYELEEQTAVDWSQVGVLNLDTGAQLPFDHDATTLTLRQTDWAAGVHRLQISVADTLGQTGVAHKVLWVGERPQPRRFTLRDDGVTLIDAQPFFPIGIFGISRQERNHYDYDLAIEELQAAGMNLGHSYRDWKSREFMASAARKGFWLWTNGKPALQGDEWFLDLARQEPANLAWYIGDDTSLNTLPQQLLDRDEACRTLDGTRLTCHADGVGAARAKSNLQDYVNFADVFMPEIYPFDGHHDERSVAEVVRDMDRCFADYAKFGRPGRPRAVWPILQCFDGMSWKRYPTAEEMYATSFAAVIHGGQGITWFMYGGERNAGSRYSGMFRTEADWAAMTNITRRLASLAPVLRERTPRQPAAPVVLSGPELDPLQQPAVTALVKTYGGHTYVLAVNAATATVRARLTVDGPDGIGKVAWEHREVRLKRGKFEDEFAPLAVHVYRF